MKTFSDFGINCGTKTGEIKTTCPQCSPQRKKQKDTCLNVNTEKGVWHCWHCEWSGTLKDGAYREWRPKTQQVVYRKPEPKIEKITDRWVDWLGKRGISVTTIQRAGLFKAYVYFPQLEREEEAICFPFIRGGELINVKYRSAEKKFRLEGKAERILYGMDDIKTGPGSCLVWVEGEIDKLSMSEAGIVSCVSVPDGAPSPNTKNYSNKFDFLESAQSILDQIERHIIAVDSDAPGKTLETELARRLGPERCLVVNWPQGCKDANEVLVRHGKQRLVEYVESARPYPISGIFGVEDVYDRIISAYENGIPRGKSTGWESIDRHYTVRLGEWTVITGVPGHGKSEWLDALLTNLTMLHGWRFAICSPENQPLELHMTKLLEKFSGKPFNHGAHIRMDSRELGDGIGWLHEYFSFILPEEVTIDCILEKARALIKRKGINGLVIDPWNEVESMRPNRMSETEWISYALGKLRRFARDNQIHLWVVAHPTKLQRDLKSKKYPVPTLYDISGSAHWRNKADNGITIWRDVMSDIGKVQVHVGKIRFKIVGKPGVIELGYDRVCGRYFEPGSGNHVEYEDARNG